MVAPLVSSNMAEFKRALERYQSVSKREMEVCLWKQLSNWAFRALRILKREPSAAAHLPADVSPRGKSANWRLVSWLATQRYQRGGSAGRLRDFARAEKSARRKSCGFVKSLMLGAAKAAKSKSVARQGTGIVARASGGRTADGRAHAAASAAYRFRGALTRAFRSRTTDGIDSRTDRALDEAIPAVVADMESYMARKLAKGVA